MIADPLQALLHRGELEAWKQVPGLVACRFKEAADIQRSITRIVKSLPAAAKGYGEVYWHPEDKVIWAVLGDGDAEQTYQRWQNALQSIPGVSLVKCEAESGPHRQPGWIRVKRSSALSWLHTPYRLAGALTGGP